MTFLLPLLAFAMVLGFTLIVAGWCENRRDRELVVIDLHRENIARALAASHRYTGRAWTRSDLVARVASRDEAGASRVSGAVKVDLRDSSNPVKVDRSRKFVDVSTVPPVRLVGGSPRTAARAANPRNTNARAHGTGVR